MKFAASSLLLLISAIAPFGAISMNLADSDCKSFTELAEADKNSSESDSDDYNRHNLLRNRRELVACAGLASTFNDRVAFNAIASGIPLEDFEGVAGPGAVIGCNGNLDSTSSTCSPNGEIEPGFALVPDTGDTVLLGPGIVPVNFTTWAASNLFAATTSLVFSDGPFAVGLDLLDFFGAPQVEVSVVGANGPICSEFVTSGGFFGILTNEPILSLQIGGSSNVIVIDNVAFGNPDTDGDGVLDFEDVCPDSIDVDGSVQIDGCDSGVSNVLVSGPGCNIADILAVCASNAINHGNFVSCVAKETNALKKADIVSGEEKGAMVACAGKANIPPL